MILCDQDNQMLEGKKGLGKKRQPICSHLDPPALSVIFGNFNLVE